MRACVWLVAGVVTGACTIGASCACVTTALVVMNGWHQADHVFDAHPCAVIGMAVLPRTTPSMTLFVTAAADGVMRMWDYGRRRLVYRRSFSPLAALKGVYTGEAADGASAGFSSLAADSKLDDGDDRCVALAKG